MKGLSAAFRFYINASLHVALAVSCLIVITTYQLEVKVSLRLLSFIFFGTIAGYNFVKYAPVAGMHHRSLTNSLKTIQVFSILCALMAVICLIYLPKSVWYVTGVFGLLTLLYAPFLEKRNLRSLTGLKIFVVALVWSGVTVFIPWSMENNYFTTDLWLLFAQIFLLVQVWTLPFEIRDLKYDSASLKTLPQQLGIKKVKGLGIVFLMLAIVLEGFKDELKQPFLLSLLLVSFISGFFLVRSRQEQGRYFASFWVEAIPIAWLGLLWILERYS